MSERSGFSRAPRRPDQSVNGSNAGNWDEQGYAASEMGDFEDPNNPAGYGGDYDDAGSVYAESARTMNQETYDANAYGKCKDQGPV